MTSYRLFPSATGPSSAVSYSGPFDAGVGFEVTSGGTWFEGYWWWVCPSGQPAAPQTFALWQVYAGSSASIVSAATVTSGALTAGQWNYVPLPNPVMLSVGGASSSPQADASGSVYYIACTAFTGGFPATNGQYGSGEPYGAGIVSGPLSAFSDQSGSLPAPFGTAQGIFSTTGSVTSNAPFDGSSSANFWMDVQVSDTAPSGYSGSYRLWPSMPAVPDEAGNDTGEQTTGTQFSLSQPCLLNSIWLYSAPGATELPGRTQVWDVATRALVPGTDLDASWSGAPGSGWVASSYADAAITLPAGNYIATVFYSGGAKFYAETRGYFGTYLDVAGPGSNGITNGPLSAPSNAAALAASGFGNSCYFTGGSSPTYPDAWDTGDGGENRWVDVEVTPASGAGTASPTPSPSASAKTADSSAFLTFFP